MYCPKSVSQPDDFLRCNGVIIFYVAVAIIAIIMLIIIAICYVLGQKFSPLKYYNAAKINTGRRNIHFLDKKLTLVKMHNVNACVIIMTVLYSRHPISVMHVN